MVGSRGQRGIVVLPEIFAESPEHLAPIIELNVGVAFHGEEGLFGAVAEVAHDRDLVIGAGGLRCAFSPWAAR